MHQRAFLGSGWTRGGVAGSGVVRRACPASGAQWNVQVVRGKVNGKCLWNACKALSLGLLLMVLGAAMATIGYYADHLSIAQEIRGNHTVRVKNESRGFHLNNLSYAGPIVMGVGGFIVVAACVMTFEARDSAAKVVPARLKLSTTGPPGGGGGIQCTHGGTVGHPVPPGLRTSSSQTAVTPHPHKAPPDRHAITQSFMQFSRGLAIDAIHNHNSLLRVSQGASISKSPSAPDLASERGSTDKTSPTLTHRHLHDRRTPRGRRTFAACALLNPGLLHRHAISVDETAPTYRLSHESLQGAGSQGSMALDLHLECPVTLRIRDRRRTPLQRQCRVEEEEKQGQHQTDEGARRSSHSCSPRLPSHYFKTTHVVTGGSAQQLPTNSTNFGGSSRRRSSNASDCTHRARTRRRDCPHTARGRLERAISSDSRLTGAALPRCHHHHHTPTQQSTEQEPPTPGGSSSDTDLRHAPAQLLTNIHLVHRQQLH